MQQRFVELIQEEKKRGKTILMSSHNFEEVERTCDRAGIIREGRLVAVENVAALKSAQRKVYVVTVADQESLQTLQQSGLEVTSVRGKAVEIVVHGDYGNMLAVLGSCQVTGLDVAAQNLEQVFMRFYGREG
jgi:ABC-2 type transport system ATP-binding protein